MDEPVTARSAAEAAAEAVRTLNHLTRSRPAVWTPGWEDFADVDAIAAELQVLAQRLPQAIDQLAAVCDDPAVVYASDNDEEPADVIVAARHGLLDAGGQRRGTARRAGARPEGAQPPVHRRPRRRRRPGGGVAVADGVHLHVDDDPATIELLRALMTGRDLSRLAEVGYRPTEHGVWVDWGLLATSWLSSTERAVVDVARACATFERPGGPPPHLVAPLRQAIDAVAARSAMNPALTMPPEFRHDGIPTW